MSIFKDEVVVIKSVNFKEADKILFVYGKNFGKYPLVAKGIRKIESKNRGNMQTLSVSNISFYKNQGMAVLTESSNVILPEYDAGVLKNIERLLLMMNKLLNEDEVIENLFEKLIFVIKNGFRSEDLNKFRLIFLKQLGVLSHGTCVNCGSGEKVTNLNPFTFELFCDNCANNEEAVYLDVTKIDYGSKQFTNYLDGYVRKVISDIY